MSARLVRGVVVDGDDLRLLGAAVAELQRARRRNALPPLPRLDVLARALAVSGQSDSAEAPEPETEPDVIDVTEAARLLDCSPRTARRLAPRLGGRLVGGRWVVDRFATLEHKEGQTL